MILTQPLLTVLDTVGNPVPGAKLYSYIAGTTTPAPVYYDSAETVPHTNPVIADAAGRLPTMYGTGPYKLLIAGADDASIRVIDNYTPRDPDLTALDTAVTAAVAAVGLRERSQEFYGVVANGIADDTTALQNYVNDAATRRDAVRLRGIIKLTNTITIPNGGAAIRGSGPNATVLRFLGGAMNGLQFAPSAADPYRRFSVEGVTFETDTANGDNAIHVDLPDGSSSNESRIFLRNVEYRGLGSGWWTVGHHWKNVSYGVAIACRFLGSVGNASAVAMPAGAWYGGQLARIDTQRVSDDPALGLSLECRHIACSAHFAQRGIEVLGYSEGQSITDCDFAGVWDGIDCVAVTSTRQPWINIKGAHVNAVRYGIRLDGYDQSTLQGVHISRWGDAGTEAWRTTNWAGIELNNASDITIDGYSILAESSSSSAGSLTGINVGTAARVSVGSGSFKGGAGALKDMTTAVALGAGSSRCYVTPNLRLTNVTTPITDAGTLNDRVQEIVAAVPPDDGSAPAEFASRQFEVGDRCRRAVAALSQPKAWVCVTAGTPGTWASEGTL
jgi:hypothetical protein